MSLDDTIAEAEAFAKAAKQGDAAPADTGDQTQTADTSATATAPEPRSFGSMLAGLIPGMSPGGWGPQNWAPAPYNAADAAVHGATFGVSDIARGAAGDLYGGPSMADVKTDRDRFAAQQPAANIGANIAGGVATAPLLPLGQAFAPVARIAEPALRYGAQALTGAGIGAGIGGAQGAIDAAPVGTDAALQGAREGAFAGGLVGAAAPFIGAGLQRGGQQLLDWWARRPALNELGVGRDALASAQRALTGDQAFAGGQGAQNIARAGPYGMAADAGPNTVGALDEAMTAGGPGALTARNAVQARGVDANRTLTGALDTALGAPEGIDTASRAVRAAGAPGIRAAYETAYARPLDYSSPRGRELEELLQRVPQGALNYANELMRNAGYTSRQVAADVAADGTVSFRSVPDMLQVDYIKRGIQQMAEAGEGAGLLGGRSTISRSRMGLAADIRDAARDLVPEYGTALRLAGDDIGHVNALQFGNEMMGKSVPRDVVRRTLADMSPHDRDMVGKGVRANIDEAVANVRNYVSNPNYDAKQASEALKDLNSQAAREKLALVVTDPLKLAQLQREIEIATSSAELVANMAANSKTAGRIAVKEARRAIAEPGVIGEALSGRPINTAQRLIQTFTGRRPQDTLAAQDITSGQIADLLTRPRDPATGRSVADVIEGILPGLARSTRASQAIGAVPGIMLPPEIEGLRQYMQPGPGAPVPRGVMPPGARRGR